MRCAHLALLLPVVNPIAEVLVLGLEEVEDGKDLSVVGHKSFTNGLRADNESLEDLESHSDDLNVSSVKGS